MNKSFKSNSVPSVPDPSSRPANGHRLDQMLFQPVVVDVDGSLTKQTEFMDLFRPEVLSLQPMQRALRYWATFENLNLLRHRFISRIGGIEGKVVFYGSGDFHNLAYVWLRMLQEPVTLIHVDNHTDLYKNQSGDVHVGNWVIHALQLPAIQKLIQLGVDGDLDVNASSFLTGTFLPIGPMMNELSALRTGKHEVYPTARRYSTLFGRIRANNPCVTFTPGLLTTAAEWKTIRQYGIETIVETILDAIPTEAVYLTIDKDALREADSFTNYYTTTQGDLTLDELLTTIRLVKRRKRIVAVDVCGDISYPVLKPLSAKQFFFLMKDRNIPRSAFTTAEHIRVNQTANIALINCLNS